MSKLRNMSESEFSVLRLLWVRHEGVVREVLEDLDDIGVTWAYTTVQTLLNRLEAKGYVKRDRSGRAHTYRATVSREELAAQRLHDLADQLCEKPLTPETMSLMTSLPLSHEDIARFCQLLNRLEESAQDTRSPTRGSG